MKRFKFKLETVLTERKRIEDLRLREWTIAKRMLQALMDDLSELESGLADGIARATDLGSSPDMSNVGMFSAVDDFIAGQKLRIIWKSQEIERGAKLTEKKRQEYIRASQKRQALEKLKERKLAEHKERAHKDELRKLDDIYIMNGAARKRMESEDGEEASA